MDLQERIKKVRDHVKINSQSDFGAIIGASRSRVAALESGAAKAIKQEEAVVIEEKFGINGWWLITGRGDMLSSVGKSNTRQVVLLPFRAGGGAEGILDEWTEPQEFVDIDSRLLPKNGSCKHPAIIQMHGESMAPIYDSGDYILLDMVNGRSFEPVDGVYLIKYGSSVQIKHVSFVGNGDIICSSENSRYPPFQPVKDFGLEWEIIAKVCGSIKFEMGLFESH